LKDGIDAGIYRAVEIPNVKDASAPVCRIYFVTHSSQRYTSLRPDRYCVSFL